MWLTARVTYNDRSHPLFEEEWGIDFLEKTKEDAVPLEFLAVCQLYTAHNVKSIPLEHNKADFD